MNVKEVTHMVARHGTVRNEGSRIFNLELKRAVPPNDATGDLPLMTMAFYLMTLIGDREKSTYRKQKATVNEFFH